MPSDSSQLWNDFIRARKLVIQWMRNEMRYDEHRIAMELSMDSNQVRIELDHPRIRQENV